MPVTTIWWIDMTLEHQRYDYWDPRETFDDYRCLDGDNRPAVGGSNTGLLKRFFLLLEIGQKPKHSYRRRPIWHSTSRKVDEFYTDKNFKEVCSKTSFPSDCESKFLNSLKLNIHKFYFLIIFGFEEKKKDSLFKDFWLLCSKTFSDSFLVFEFQPIFSPHSFFAPKIKFCLILILTPELTWMLILRA